MNDERLALSDDPRGLRIEQLEHALSARVVIEQAKGIIFERFGLSMSDSFELLRHAARTHRVKLRRLAEELVATRATPTAIIEAFVRIGREVPEGFRSRVIRSERQFGDLNDALLAVHRETTWTKFVCECANPLCAETITLSVESMETIRRHPSRYVLKAGHQVEGVDRVIDRIDGLVIVEEPVDDAAPTLPDHGRSP